MSVYDLLSAQEQYIQSLDAEHKDVLHWYTTYEFDRFNELMRAGLSLPISPVNFQRHRQLLDEIFSSSPSLNVPLTVYRGINGEFNATYTNVFISTTADKKTALQFTGRNCCFLDITLSPGSKVLPLRTLSAHPGEEELLIDRGGTLLRTKEEKHRIGNKHIRVIFLVYVPPNTTIISDEKELDVLQLSPIDNTVISRIVENIKDDRKDKEYDDEDEDEDDEEEPIQYYFKGIVGRDPTTEEIATIKAVLNK